MDAGDGGSDDACSGSTNTEALQLLMATPFPAPHTHTPPCTHKHANENCCTYLFSAFQMSTTVYCIFFSLSPCAVSFTDRYGQCFGSGSRCNILKFGFYMNSKTCQLQPTHFFCLPNSREVRVQTNALIRIRQNRSIPDRSGSPTLNLSFCS